MQIVIAIYNRHICTQWSTLKCSGLYNCDVSMVILFGNTIATNRIYNIIVKVTEMGPTMTLKGLDWYFHLQWTNLYSMKYIEHSGLNICDASMNIAIYRNIFLKFIFTMFQQRIRNVINNDNRGLRMGCHLQWM